MQAVLICGWQDTPFMLELLSDLDRGNNKLPRGSEVTLMNLHPGEEIARHIKRLGRCRIAIRHIEANPLHRESFQKVRSHSARYVHISTSKTLCTATPAKHGDHSLQDKAYTIEHERLWVVSYLACVRPTPRTASSSKRCCLHSAENGDSCHD
jgi:hypothetical protein